MCIYNVNWSLFYACMYTIHVYYAVFSKSTYNVGLYSMHVCILFCILCILCIRLRCLSVQFMCVCYALACLRAACLRAACLRADM